MSRCIESPMRALTQHNRLRARFQQRGEERKAETDSLNEVIKRFETQLAELQQNNAIVDKQVLILITQNAALKETNATLHETISELSAQNAELKQQFEHYKATTEVLISQIKQAL